MESIVTVAIVVFASAPSLQKYESPPVTLVNGCFDNAGWCRCGGNMMMSGMQQAGCRQINCFNGVRCAKPDGPVTVGNCQTVDVSSEMAARTTQSARCPAGTLLNGIYRTSCTALSCITQFECCNFYYEGRLMVVTSETRDNWVRCMDYSYNECDVPADNFLNGLRRSSNSDNWRAIDYVWYSGVQWATEAPDTSIPDTRPPDTQAPDTSPPRTLPPSTGPPVTLPPDTLAPDTRAPSTLPPDTRPPDTQAPDTSSPDTQPPDTQAPDTSPPRTVPPDTDPPDTLPPDTIAPDTRAPSTLPPDTRPPYTQAPDTSHPDTYPPDTGLPDTLPPDTRAPSTLPPDTQAPNTSPPHTLPPDTDPPDTLPPDTLAPNTGPPDTLPPDTRAPSTLPPDTRPPDTQAPDTSHPDTYPPDTGLPDTLPPDTRAPSTLPPDTQAPNTSPPHTLPPDTDPPDTLPPDTLAPNTGPPDTLPPDTRAPSTLPPDTRPPDTQAPDTSHPDTYPPDTGPPDTRAPDTYPPNTPPPDTLPPDTLPPHTLPPDTLAPNTYPPGTVAPNTPAPDTATPKSPAPDTRAPITHPPNTPSPVTHSPETIVPVTAIPLTTVPTTRAPDTIAPNTITPYTSGPETSAPSTLPPDTDIVAPGAIDTLSPDTPPPDSLAPPSLVPSTQPPDTSVPPNTLAPLLTPAPGTVPPNTMSPETGAPRTEVPVDSESGNGTGRGVGMDFELLGGATIGLSMLGDPSGAGIAVRLLLVVGDCHADLKKFPVIIHPTQISVSGSEALGVVFGNSALAVLAASAFQAIHEATELPVEFPAALLYLSVWLYQGIVLGAAALISSWKNKVEVLSGFATMLVALLLPVSILRITRKDVPKKAIYRNDSETKNAVFTALFGPGEWVARKHKYRNWVTTHGAISRPWRQPTVWYAAMHFIEMLAIGWVAAQFPETSVQCGHSKVALSIILFISAGLLLKVRPYCTPRDNIMVFVVLMLQVAGLCMVAASHYKMMDRMHNGRDVFLAATILLLTKAVLDVTGVGATWSRRTRLRMAPPRVDVPLPEEMESVKQEWVINDNVSGTVVTVTPPDTPYSEVSNEVLPLTPALSLMRSATPIPVAPRRHLGLCRSATRGNYDTRFLPKLNESFDTMQQTVSRNGGARTPPRRKYSRVRHRSLTAV